MREPPPGQRPYSSDVHPASGCPRRDPVRKEENQNVAARTCGGTDALNAGATWRVYYFLSMRDSQMLLPNRLPLATAKPNGVRVFGFGSGCSSGFSTSLYE